MSSSSISTHVRGLHGRAGVQSVPCDRFDQTGFLDPVANSVFDQKVHNAQADQCGDKPKCKPENDGSCGVVVNVHSYSSGRILSVGDHVQCADGEQFTVLAIESSGVLELRHINSGRVRFSHVDCVTVCSPPPANGSVQRDGSAVAGEGEGTNLAGLKVLVPVSGGKDSQLCLQLAVEKYGCSSVRGLFCDTGFEHPLTYQHVGSLASRYGVEVDVVQAGTVPEKVRRYGRFPSGAARFCTDELKIRPTVNYLKQLAPRVVQSFEVWYGVRISESNERAVRYSGRVSDELMAPHEFMPGKYPQYLSKLGVSVRLPIIDWGTWEVRREVGKALNPLYSYGFDRVGCFPCLAAGDVHKERAFRFDDVGRHHKAIVLQLEKETGKSVWTSKGGAMRNNPAQLCMLCMA